MEIRGAVIVSVVMAALFANTFATYSQTSTYSAVSYSEVDSAEQKSHEATYPAGIRTAPYSNSEEEAEYVTTPYPVHFDANPVDGTVSYTTVAYSAPDYNEPQLVASTYTPPVYSPSTYTAPTLDVPIYRAPAVLPYWMRSGYAENSTADANAVSYKKTRGI
ncbi:hypothetical protein GHT06_020748 [Daphnia sinensis]|uniref:Uncharacterized protein n=1 Tax=Daphnia sinensis TaxID=1820382 RepID=A0AAD5KIU6_9CRUS|nr:hypothetical protein GHT06_020748 [Daphnia sinensis]